MSCATLQASLLFRPSPSLHFSHPPPPPPPPPSSSSSSSRRHHRSHFSLSSPSSSSLCFSSPQSLPALYRLSSILLLKSRFRPFPCTLRPDNVASHSDSPPKDPAAGFDESRGGDFDGGVSDLAETSSVSAADGLGLDNGFVDGEGRIDSGSAAGEEKDERRSKFPVVVLLMGLWAAVKRAVEKVMEWEWLSWWPFSRQEKRLEKLIAEADANPKDAALQSALLAELNKHR